MKKFVILVIVLLAGNAFGQKVSVSKKSERIKGESAEGYGTSLEGKKEDVATAWGRYIKDLGKVKSGVDYQYVEGAAMGGTVYTTGIVYARSGGSAESGSVWLGIKAAEWTVNDIKLVEDQLEKLVYQFGIKFYRDKIQAQIDEAQLALSIVVRQQQRLVTENKSLNTKLTNNELQKIQLEKSLEANKLENLVLLQKIINNKNAQDSVGAATIPIKKVVDMHQERLRKVN
ncbi:MAG: hypothetical protein SH819_05680 [Cytophagales bacterium]|nr:hypothetical protein [Cytophagales bacterium]